MDTTLLHEICNVLDIKDKKREVIRLQKYEEGDKLRDMEKQVLSNISKMMVSSGLIKSIGGETGLYISIEKEIDQYLLSNYGVSYMGDDTSTSLKRHLKLEEIFRKD